MSAIRTPSGLATLAAISLRDGASVLQSVASGSIRTVAGLRAFFSAMSVSAAPDPAGFGNSTGAILVTTGSPAVATVSGGVAPYTYAWRQTDGSDWTITTDTALSTTFSIPVDPATLEDGTFVCDVTDSTGFVATSNEVTATCTNLGGGAP